MHVRTVDSDEVSSSPFFAQAVEVTKAGRLLFVDGQIPASVDGTVPLGFEDQARLVWANPFAQVRAAGMGPDNLVKVTILLADDAHVPMHRIVADDVLAGRRIAVSTIIAGMVEPVWLVEIEGIAAA